LDGTAAVLPTRRSCAVVVADKSFHVVGVDVRGIFRKDLQLRGTLYRNHIFQEDYCSFLNCGLSLL
jgi:hypothetical protein